MKGIDIQGLEEVQDLLKDFAVREARTLNRQTIHAIATEIKDSAKEKAPVGETKTIERALKAIRRKPRNPDKPFSDVRVTRGTNQKYDAWYWHFLEYGTVKQSAQPFIRPAIADVRPRIIGLYRSLFRQKYEAKLRREARKRAGL